MKKFLSFLSMLFAIGIISSCDKADEREEKFGGDLNIISGPGEVVIKVFQVQLHRKNGSTSPRNGSKPCDCTYCFGLCYPEGTWEPQAEVASANVALRPRSDGKTATIYFLKPAVEEASWDPHFYVGVVNRVNFDSFQFDILEGSYPFQPSSGSITIGEESIAHYGYSVVNIQTVDE
jgi:hypothetical protein